MSDQSQDKAGIESLVEDRYHVTGSRVSLGPEQQPWTLVERYIERFPDDWRLLFRRGDETLEVQVPEEVWRAFDA